MFSGLSKTDDINKKAKSILEKYKSIITTISSKHKNSIDGISSFEKLSDTGSKHSHYTNSNLMENKTVEVTDKNEKILILTLMTFHQGDKISA